MKRKPRQSAASSPQPEITYIVSAYNRPLMLPVILWAIKGQTHTDFECIVTDNATNDSISKHHQKTIKQMEDSRFKYVRTANKIKVSDCYWSAEWAIKHLARGRWLCFPCDDTYLVPEFGKRMLMAACEQNADLVICSDIIFGPEPLNGDIGYKRGKMRPGRAVKTSMLMRADKFSGFSGKVPYYGAVLADWHLSGSVANVAVLQDQFMVVHN